jgi:hypothetical protein
MVAEQLLAFQEGPSSLMLVFLDTLFSMVLKLQHIGHA